MDPDDLLALECPFCRTVFWGPRSLKGGYASCPECRKAFEVKGGPEAAFWVVVGLASLLILGLAAGAGAIWGWTGALIVGGVGLLILVISILAM